MPSKKTDVLVKFKEFMNEIILTPDDKIFIEQLPIKYKWRLIKRHEIEKSNMIDLDQINV